MPPLPSATKGKHKSRDGRRSRSRNTTPSSVISGTAPSQPAQTAFLELDTSKLLVGPQPQYIEILEQLETKPTNLDPKRLQDIIEQLKVLSDSAEKRVESCERAVRLIHEQMRDVEFDQKERDRQAEQTRRSKAKKEESSKNVKAKKRKERPGSSDGVEIKKEDNLPSDWTSRVHADSLSTSDTSAAKTNTMRSLKVTPAKRRATDEPIKTKGNRANNTPGPTDSPSPSKKTKLSPGTSSLSEVADSPGESKSPGSKKSPAPSDASSDAEDNRVVHKAPAIPQQGYFPDPLAYDPTVYHIEEVTPDMTDEEKKRIYSVTAYPTKDLSDQIAGQPPDKDFSNAKPTNQVAANTFLTYAEPFLRPLTEEDIAFLRERGDRTTPFLAIPRGKRSYQEIWAEEDGMMMDSSDHASLNQGRGNVEQLTDETAATDSVSTGPLASRLLSLLKFEHRSDSSENGVMDFMGDGNDTMDLDGLTNGNDGGDKPLPPAAAISEQAGSKSSQRLDYIQSEERIKAELRHLGLLGQEENPDFDAHHDDEISERLRWLQQNLRRVMVTNGARKARLLDMAKERLAYQEYSTIHEDLDSQVQQAYLKRTRTLGKAKKGGPGAKPRPGHVAAAVAGGLGINRARDIGDSARMLMDRRKRWENCIGPVFKDMKRGVPDSSTTIFDSKVMEYYEKQELEQLEEEEGE